MATTIVEQSGGQYHVLVIIADGQVCPGPFLLFYWYFCFRLLLIVNEEKNETYLSIIMALSEAIIVQVTRSVDTEFGQLSTQEQMTVDAIVQAR
jgi:E3 ubiquitin-protein ligase RGLG